MYRVGKFEVDFVYNKITWVIYYHRNHEADRGKVSHAHYISK